MSFGFSVGDFILLTKLAYTTVQNARDACGVHDSLTKEVTSLHVILMRVETEVSKEESIVNRPGDNRKEELAELARGCKGVLRVLSQILEKYNALPTEKRRATKLWQKIKFGNGEMQDLGKIRSELTTYTQAITIFLNLLSIGSQGKVERYMESHGEELREIKHSLNWVTASLQANTHEEGSILTSYAEDDKAVWKSFRRELIKEGFSSEALGKHKKLIKRYISELCERGALDDVIDACVEADNIQVVAVEGRESDIQEASCSTTPSIVVSTIQEGSDALDVRNKHRPSVNYSRMDITNPCRGKEDPFRLEHCESSVGMVSPPTSPGQQHQKSLDDAEVCGMTAKRLVGAITLGTQLSRPRSPENLEVFGSSPEHEPQLFQEETQGSGRSTLRTINNSNSVGQSFSDRKGSDGSSQIRTKTTPTEEDLSKIEQSESVTDSNSSTNNIVISIAPDTIYEISQLKLVNGLSFATAPRASPAPAEVQSAPIAGNTPKHQSRYQAYVEDLDDEEYHPEAHPNCFSEANDADGSSHMTCQEDEQLRSPTTGVHRQTQVRHTVTPISPQTQSFLTYHKLRKHGSIPLEFVYPPSSATIGSDDEDNLTEEVYAARRKAAAAVAARLQPLIVTPSQCQRLMELTERLKSHVCPMQLKEFKLRMLEDRPPDVVNPPQSSNEAQSKYQQQVICSFPNRHQHQRSDQNKRSKLKSFRRRQHFERLHIESPFGRRVWVSRPDESCFTQLYVANNSPVTSESYISPSEDGDISWSDGETTSNSSGGSSSELD